MDSMTRRRLGVTAFALLIIGTTISANLFSMRQASAAPDPVGTGGSSSTVQFLDRAHIMVQMAGTSDGGDMSKASGIYYNSDMRNGKGYGQGGPKHVGVSKAGGKECVSQINVKQYGDNGPGQGGQATADITFKIPPTDGNTNGCITVKRTDYPIVNPAQGITDRVPVWSYVADPVASSVMYFKNDDKTILQADADPTYDNSSNNEWHFVSDGKTQCNSSLNYLRQNGGGKPDFITKADTGGGVVEADYVNQNGGDPCSYTLNDKSVNASHHVLVSLTRPDANTPFANGAGANGTDDLCSIPTWGLRWLACPLLLAAQEAIKGLDKVYQQLLIIGAGGMFDTNTATGKAFLDGELTFSKVAFSGLIVAALVIVAAQTGFGLEIFSPYTIRKALPRLLAMVVVLVLLVPIEKFLVQLTDNLTNWLGDMVAYPFRSLGDATTTGFGQIAGQWLAGAAAFTFLSIGGVLSLAATMLLGMFVLIAVLLGRKAIIFLVLITAPIGVVANILPNTRPLAKFMFKDLAFTAAALGPAISITLGITMGMAHVFQAANLGGVGGTAAVGIMVLGMLAPAYLAQRIGGVIGTVSGIANDRSRGGFDRLKNYRGNKIKENSAALAGGNRFGQTIFGKQNYLAKGVNAASRNTVNSVRTVQRGGLNPQSWKRTYSQLNDQQAMHEAIETMQSDGYKHNKDNDDMLSVGHYDSESQAIRGLSKRKGWDEDRARNAVAAAKAAGMKIGSEGFRVAGAMGRVSTGTGYDNMQDMAETLGHAAHGNEAMARRLAGFANAESKTKGRHDWAPGYGRLSELVIGETRGGVSKPTGRAYDKATIEAALGTDNATLGRDKPQAIGNVTIAMQRELGHTSAEMASTDANVRQAAEQMTGAVAAKLANMRDSGVYAPEVNAVQVNAVVRSAPVTNAQLAVQPGVVYDINTRRPVVDANGHVVTTTPPSAEGNDAYNLNRLTMRGGGPDDPRMPGAA
jgi:hypothetical protein